MPFAARVSQQNNLTEEPEVAQRQSRWLGRIPVYLGLALLLAVCGVRLVAFLQIGLDWLGYYPAASWRPGSEGLIFDETLRVRYGLPIYGPITQTSFISGPYPPVFYYLCAFVMNFTGENMLAGRLLSFISAIGSALLVALLVGEIGLKPLKISRWLSGLAAGAALLTTPPFLIWASRNRGDVLMVFFALAGCYALLKWQSKNFVPKFWWPALSIVCFVLACYTKQTALVAPVAAVLWLLLRRPKTGLIYGAILAAGLLLPFLALEIVTRHEFYRHMVTYHALPWSGSEWLEWLKTFAGDNFWWLLAGVSWIIFSLFYAVWGWRKSIVNSSISDRIFQRLKVVFAPQSKSVEIPLSALFCAGALIGTFSIGVKGGDHNHLLLPAAAICWAAGSALATLLVQPGWTVRLAGVVLTVLLAAQLWFGWEARLNYYSFDLAKPSSQNQARLDGILNYIRSVDGPVLSEEVALPALAGKTVEYNDVFTMGALASVGKWKPDALAEQIRQKHFSLILLPIDLERSTPSSRNIWPPELLEAIRQSYYVKFRDVWFIYEPRT